MTNKHLGWMLFAGSMGMVFVLVGADIKNLKSYDELYTMYFIGNAMGHLGNTLLAFAGGKLIPTEPHNQRENDK